MNASELPLAMLVVLEPGARWPKWVERHRTTEDSVVIVRQPDENRRELLERIQHAGAKLAAAGRCIKTAVLALAEGGHASAMSERAAIARALMPHICRRAGAMVIVAPAVGHERRHDLLALCGALSKGVAGSGIAVLAELADPIECPDAQPEEWRLARCSGIRICGVTGTDTRGTSVPAPRAFRAQRRARLAR